MICDGSQRQYLCSVLRLHLHFWRFGALHRSLPQASRLLLWAIVGQTLSSFFPKDRIAGMVRLGWIC